MKAFFFSRVFREKLLLLGLILLAAVTWFSSVTKRTAVFFREYGATSVELRSQQEMLVQQKQIESEAEAAIKHLEPAKTLDGIRLQSELAELAKGAGVTNYSLDNVQTQRVSQFSMNSVQMQIRNADYASLVKFYIELSKRSPYIGIEQFRLTANNAKHSVSMRLSSVEVAK